MELAGEGMMKRSRKKYEACSDIAGVVTDIQLFMVLYADELIKCHVKAVRKHVS